MDFNLIDSSSFHCKIESDKTVVHKLHNIPDGIYPGSSKSSNFELSGGSFPALAATAAAPHCNYTYAVPPANNSSPVESKFPLFAQNAETTSLSNFPCAGVILSSQRRDSMEAMRETIFRMAMMQPIQIDPESVKPPARKNVRISKDPQSVAARHRRERISHRIRILQRMVPGGTKLDTASMLDEAVHYLKFLKRQIQSLERAAVGVGGNFGAGGVLPLVGSVNGYMRFD